MKKLIINLVELEEWAKDENGNVKLDEKKLAVTQRVFLVDTIKNSIDFKPGQKLSESQVRDLVNVSAFEVNVRRPRNSDFPSN